MKKICLVLSATVLLLVPGTICSQATLSSAAKELPPTFEENRGQLPEEFRFLIRDGGYAVGLGVDRLEFRPFGSAAGQSLQLSFSGANQYPVLSGEVPLPGKVHYLIGSDPDSWITDVSTYSSARYRSIYQGIDLVVGGRRGALILEFELAPAADHENLVIELQGLETVELGSNGEVLIGNTIRLLAPEIVQRTAEGEIPLAGSYFLFNGNRIAINPAERDIDLPLTIRIGLDSRPSSSGPIVSGEELALAVADDGDVIVAGRTIPFGAGEAYVTRLTDDESAVVFTTYFGGSGNDVPAGVAVDASGQVVVVGGTTSGNDFPSGGGVTGATAGHRDAFVVKISPDGSDLIHSALLGGQQQDQARDVAIGPDQSVWIIGDTEGDFPVAGNAIDRELGGSTDAWLAHLSADDSELLFSTLLGGSGKETGAALALDRDSNVYVTGTTHSADFPLLVPIQEELGSPEGDIFLAKLSSDGELLYSTFLGSSRPERGTDLKVDRAGSVYVSGWRSGHDLTSRMPERLSGRAAGRGRRIAGYERPDSGDAFIVKVDPGGTAVAWSAPLGGSGEEDGHAITLDDDGKVWIAGATGSVDFPVVDARQPFRSGDDDAFLSTFSADGSRLIRSTYLGGMGSESASAIETDGDQVLVLGRSSSGDLPGTRMVGLDSGGHSVFLTRVGADDSSLLAAGCPGTINFDNSAGNGLWQELTNWDTDVLPTSTDDVCIDGYAVNLSTGSHNAGTLFVSGTGSLTISGGALTLASASQIDSGFGMSGGTLNGTGSVTLNGTFDWTGGLLDGSGEVLANGTVNMTGAGTKMMRGRTLRNATTLNWSGSGQIQLGGGSAFINDGTWEVTNDGWFRNVFGGSASFTNNGTFRKSAGAGTTQLAATFNNAGLVEVLTGTLNPGSGYTQTAGSTILNGGSLLAPTALDIQGGTLGGNGIVSAHVNNSGSTAPGLSAGRLRIDGQYTQAMPGRLTIELGGLASETEHDQLAVTSTAVLNGNLDVTLINSYVPVEGDRFTILTAGSVAGTFGTVNTPALPGGEQWQALYNADSVELLVGATCSDDDGYAICNGTCTLDPGDACGDCDDGDPTSNPGAEELCDGVDNDCDSVVPADEADGDNDGFRICDSDSDDSDNAINPGATELCADGVDNDCDELTDDADFDDCGTGGPRTICATLGDDASSSEDVDVFVFTGAVGERVSLALELVDASGLPGRATLLLVDATSGHGNLIGSDRTVLPNGLTKTLEFGGEYRVGVREGSNYALLTGQKFSGAYCLTLDSDQGAGQSLQPTSSVEGLGSTIDVTKSMSRPRSVTRTRGTPSDDATTGRTRRR